MSKPKACGVAEAGTIMDAAIAKIDERFGVGYAKEHPQLVIAFMSTAVKSCKQQPIKHTKHDKTEAEITRELVGDALKNVNPKTYRPVAGGPPATPEEREIPDELAVRDFVPGELDTGNVPINLEELKNRTP